MVFILDEIIIALTGSSGIQYGIRLVEYLNKMEYPITVIVSEGAKKVAKYETEINIENWINEIPKVEKNDNLASAIASGSYKTAGMIIIPCSSKTLGLIANDIEINLITRAAMCQLKEGRPLIIVPRETPISLPYIMNLKKCVEAGVKVVPAMPGFYHKPENINDIIDFIVGKTLDQLNIEHNLFRRWK